jgi:hypothetical protein
MPKIKDGAHDDAEKKKNKKYLTKALKSQEKQ